MVLQPDSSVEGGPETAALYCKFPTFFNKEQLYDHIQKHGFGKNVVAIDMHYRKFTKTPAGSAKVSIVPPALMEAFIEALHGTCLPGEFQQLLSVQPYAQIQKEDQSHKVFVGSGLPHTVTQEDIQKHFVKLKDEITNVEIKTEKKRNTCYVLIAFRSRTAAKQAVDIYHHTIFLEKRIKVEMYQPQHMMRTLSPTPNMYAAKSTTGSKVRQRDANSKDETYTDNSVSKSSAHYSSAMSTKLKRGYSHANIHLKSQQKSISKYTDKRKKSSTVIVIAENLDPKFSIIDLEYLTNVKIDNYTPSHLTPDKAAAWIEVSNDMDARIIADCLNERIIVGREIHCSMAKSTALYKLMTRREAKAHVPCSIISKAIHVNHHPLPVAADGSSCPQIMETDMKEMACHQPLASISPISPQCSMLPIIDV